MDDLLIAAAAAASVVIIAAASLQRRKRRYHKKQCWVKKWVGNRPGRGLWDLQNDLTVDPLEYLRFLRMDEATFEELLRMVSPAITKQDTIMRKSISARDRLLVTLRFLATGQPYSELQYSARIPLCTLSRIVPETLQAIFTVLKDPYLKVPNTKEEWMTVAEDFYSMTDFANCIGAIDGKHIKIKPPQGMGGKYWCYKGYNSIILLAMVDARGRFVYVDVGANGRVGDAAVFHRSMLKKCLFSRSILNMPTTGRLPNSSRDAPFVALADDAFPLSVNVMKPYPIRQITREEKHFNYRLSRARVMVECAFGILANRFRIFLTSIHLEPNKVKLITLTACALHNFLLEKLGNDYARLQTNAENQAMLNADDDQRMSHLTRQADVGSGMHGGEVRDLFKEYYNGPGYIQRF